MDTTHYDPAPLVRARKAKGWTQKYVAGQLGKTIMTVSRLESGDAVSFNIVSAACKLYGIPVVAVIREEGVTAP